MDVDRCRATVFLQEPLRRSLAAKLGGEVVSMQRCILAEGHADAHCGVPAADGRPLLRWEGRGIRFSETTYGDNAAPGRNGARHAVADAVARDPNDALWAMAAALDRLADVISAAVAAQPR
ncbi:hypothetical protein [Mycolicibacterium phlei]|jgi:hypothetical protein